MKQRMTASIIFWGSIWGILEATLGWGLHSIHFPHVGLIMYPVGAYCMLCALNRIGKEKVLVPMGVATVAALLKTINYFMVPSSIMFCVTNASVSILLEGLVLVVFLYAKKGGWLRDIALTSILVFGTFIVFRSYQVFNDWQLGISSPFHQFTSVMLFNWIWTAVVQGVIVVVLERYADKLQLNIPHLQTWEYRLALPVLVCAVVLTMVLNLRVC